MSFRYQMILKKHFIFFLIYMVRLFFMISLWSLLAFSSFLKSELISSSSTTRTSWNTSLLLHGGFALMGFLGAPGHSTILGILDEGEFGVLHSWKSIGIWRSLAMVELKREKRRERKQKLDERKWKRWFL